jgi:phenylpyruvate tautomerase PptA (4-oxalocrotonate tautomerase family)
MIDRRIFYPRTFYPGLKRVSPAEGSTAVPLYTVMTQDGFLSAGQRDVIAAELVRIHTAAMDVPAHFVHSIFPTYPRNHAYVAADHSPVASILGVIRAGHSSEEKTQLVQALWKMFQDNTGTSDSDLSVAPQEVPPSQAMENGGVMPDDGHGKEPS